MYASMVPLRGRIEAGEQRHDLAAREDLDPEPPPAHLFDDLRQPLRRPLEDVVRRGPGRRHPPLDLRLGDDVGASDERVAAIAAAARSPWPEPASVRLHAVLPFSPPRTGGTRLRRRGPRGPPALGISRRTRETFRAMAVFSDSSRTTSVASFLRSRSTGTGTWRTSTLPLNSVRNRPSAAGVLGVEVREAVDLNARRGVVEDAPQIHGKRLVGLSVEGELAHRSGLVPAGVVVGKRAVRCKPRFMSSCGPTNSPASITPCSRAP